MNSYSLLANIQNNHPATKFVFLKTIFSLAQTCILIWKVKPCHWALAPCFSSIYSSHLAPSHLTQAFTTHPLLSLRASRDQSSQSKKAQLLVSKDNKEGSVEMRNLLLAAKLPLPPHWSRGQHLLLWKSVPLRSYVSTSLHTHARTSPVQSFMLGCSWQESLSHSLASSRKGSCPDGTKPGIAYKVIQ